MADIVITTLVVAAAAGAIAFNLYRSLRGKSNGCTGCSCKKTNDGRNCGCEKIG